MPLVHSEVILTGCFIVVRRKGLQGDTLIYWTDQCSSVFSETGEFHDAVHAHGVKGFGQSHRRQDGGEPSGQPRGVRPRGQGAGRLDHQNRFGI
jgi:hypothetical protein